MGVDRHLGEVGKLAEVLQSTIGTKVDDWLTLFCLVVAVPDNLDDLGTVCGWHDWKTLGWVLDR